MKHELYEARKRTTVRTALAIAIAMVVGLLSVLQPTTAWAAQVAVTLSGQQFDRQSSTSGESIQLSFNWAIPDNSRAGDTFTVVLPEQLRPSSTAAFELRNLREMLWPKERGLAKPPRSRSPAP